MADTLARLIEDERNIIERQQRQIDQLTADIAALREGLEKIQLICYSTGSRRVAEDLLICEKLLSSSSPGALLAESTRPSRSQGAELLANLRGFQVQAIGADQEVERLTTELESARADTERLEWLSDHMAYVMMIKPENNVMYSLPNNGKGWKDGELRAAIDAARETGKL